MVEEVQENQISQLIDICCISREWARFALESADPPWDLSAAALLVVSNDFAPVATSSAAASAPLPPERSVASMTDALSLIDRAIEASLSSGLTHDEENYRIEQIQDLTGLGSAASREALSANEWHVQRTANLYVPGTIYIDPDAERRKDMMEAASRRVREEAEEAKIRAQADAEARAYAIEKSQRLERLKEEEEKSRRKKAQELAAAASAAAAMKRREAELARKRASASTIGCWARIFLERKKKKEEAAKAAAEAVASVVTAQKQRMLTAASIINCTCRQFLARAFVHRKRIEALTAANEASSARLIIRVIRQFLIKKQAAAAAATATAAAKAKAKAKADADAKRMKEQRQLLTAATVISSAWKRHLAVQVAAAARNQKAQEALERIQAGAVEVISGCVRQWQARRCLTKRKQVAAAEATAQRAHARNLEDQRRRRDEEVKTQRRDASAAAAAAAAVLKAQSQRAAEMVAAQRQREEKEKMNEGDGQGGKRSVEKEEKQEEQDNSTSNSFDPRAHSDAMAMLYKENSLGTGTPLAPAVDESWSAQEKNALLRAAAAHRARLDEENVRRQTSLDTTNSTTTSVSSNGMRRRGSLRPKHYHRSLSGYDNQEESFQQQQQQQQQIIKRGTVTIKIVNGVEYERVGGGWAPLNPESTLWKPRDAIRMAKKIEKLEQQPNKAACSSMSRKIASSTFKNGLLPDIRHRAGLSYSIKSIHGDQQGSHGTKATRKRPPEKPAAALRQQALPLQPQPPR